jgi:hypothetical protein
MLRCGQQYEMFVSMRWIDRLPVARQRRISDRRCGQLRRSTDIARQNK